MRKFPVIHFASFWLAILVGFAAFAGTHDQANDGSKNIVATAASTGQFKTLTKVLAAAGLTSTLTGEGPFTVFAPTDEAFAALPEGTLEDLLRPENRDQLRSILTYHVVAGDVRAADVSRMDTAASLQGELLDIQSDDSGVTVADAAVVKADVLASNGVIHVIDKVMLPPQRES